MFCNWWYIWELLSHKHLGNVSIRFSGFASYVCVCVCECILAIIIIVWLCYIRSQLNASKTNLIQRAYVQLHVFNKRAIIGDCAHYLALEIVFVIIGRIVDNIQIQKMHIGLKHIRTPNHLFIKSLCKWTIMSHFLFVTIGVRFWRNIEHRFEAQRHFYVDFNFFLHTRYRYADLNLRKKNEGLLHCAYHDAYVWIICDWHIWKKFIVTGFLVIEWHVLNR